MADYRISEVARATGFSASTLRFYEDVGLLGPAGRSGNGYRRYDDRDLERLRFIGRCKRLGLSLDEIAGLIQLFDLDECAPVQERLRDLLVAKRRGLADQVAELERLSAELARVADRLGLAAPSGACDDTCACVADDADPARVMPIPNDSPIVCTLDAAARPERLAAWHRLAEHVVERLDISDGVHLRFAPDISAAEVTDLAAKEHECCAFFRFSVGIDDRGTTLDITSPPDAVEMIDRLIATA